MNAVASAARARDPDRVTLDSPVPESRSQSFVETESADENPKQTLQQCQSENGEEETQSETFSKSSPAQNSKVPHATSLPPEILGLYSKTNNSAHNELTTLASAPIQEEGSTHRASDESATPVEGLANGSSEVPRDHIIAEPIWGPATLDSCPVIMIPKNFQPRESTKLTDDLVVGKHISSGLQGGVYDLRNLDGSKANMIFKIVHPHAPLAEVEREWEVGMRLNQLAEHDGSLPGFMGVGAGIRGSGRFRGMLLERLHGHTVNKIICTRDFHDVQYVHAMLYSVFSALDRAQGALGFHHSDLRLANVMEITIPNEEERRASGGMGAGVSQRRLSKDVHELEEHPEQQDPELVRDKLRYQFKIIDYGLANFDETFAAGPDVAFEDEKDTGMSSRRSINLQRQHSVSPATGCVAAFPFPMVKNERLGDLPSTSALEKLYRFMWRRKGDVYHLVFELGEWLDGRVWPSQDELDVLRLMDFIEHVTGVRMRYWFSDETTGEDSVGGWRDRACGPFERHDSAMHFLRRWSVRLRSWINPSNPGITAAEALTAPFFTKRISLRGVIHGCSTRYSKWTKAPKQRRSASRSGKRSVSLSSVEIERP